MTSCHHKTGPIKCVDTNGGGGVATVEDIAACDMWKGQGGGWSFKNGACTPDWRDKARLMEAFHRSGCVQAKETRIPSGLWDYWGDQKNESVVLEDMYRYCTVAANAISSSKHKGFCSSVCCGDHECGPMVCKRQSTVLVGAALKESLAAAQVSKDAARARAGEKGKGKGSVAGRGTNAQGARTGDLLVAEDWLVDDEPGRSLSGGFDYQSSINSPGVYLEEHGYQLKELRRPEHSFLSSQWQNQLLEEEYDAVPDRYVGTGELDDGKTILHIVPATTTKEGEYNVECHYCPGINLCMWAEQRVNAEVGHIIGSPLGRKEKEYPCPKPGSQPEVGLTPLCGYCYNIVGVDYTI